MIVSRNTIGLNVTEAYLLDSVTRRRYFADIASLGVGWVRVELPWRGIAPKTGQRVWTVADQVVNDATQAGLQVVVVFAHPPSSWLLDLMRIPASPPSPEIFGALVKDVVARYPQVSAWEMWNEQNLHAFFPGANPAKYVPYQKAGYVAAKSANPSTKVLFGGLASAATASGFIFPVFWHNTDPVEFLTGAYQNGVKGYFDALAYHPYSSDRGFRHIPFNPANEYIAALGKLNQVMAANGDVKPVWVTEFGFASTNPEQDQTQGLAAELDYLASLSFVERAAIYCYADNMKATYGITTGSTPKPAYNWLKAGLGASNG